MKTKLFLLLLLIGLSAHGASLKNTPWTTTTNPQVAINALTTNSTLTVNGVVTETNINNRLSGIFEGPSGNYVFSSGTNLTNSVTAAQAIITAWSYTNAFGIVPVAGGFSNIVAGRYSIAFGAGVASGNSDIARIYLLTNSVHCPVIEFNAQMATTAVFETGFKRVTLTLPANCLTQLATSNNAASPLRLQNVTFTISGSN